MKQVFGFVLLFLILFAASASAEFFKYVDKDGNIHFTDDYSQVPENQREGVRKYEESRADTDTAPDAAEKMEAPLPADETPDSLQTDAQKDIQISNAVKKEFDTKRQALDAEYAALMEEKKELEVEKPKVQPGIETQNYVRKAKAFNQKIMQYELKRRAFNTEIEEYRTQLLKGPDQ